MGVAAWLGPAYGGRMAVLSVDLAFRRWVDLGGVVLERTEPGAPREYLLTEKGRGLKAVIIALNDWGDRWLRPGPIDYIHRNCGGLTRQVVICECCATEVPLDEVGVRPRKL